jgi:type I restriction enzyme M protein
MNHSEIVSFIWGVADLIRDTLKRGKYQDVILPLTVLRRLDCVLARTKDKVLAKQAELKGKKLGKPRPAASESRGLRLLQHLALRLREAPCRRAAPGGEPAQLHRRLQSEHA